MQDARTRTTAEGWIMRRREEDALVQMVWERWRAPDGVKRSWEYLVRQRGGRPGDVLTVNPADVGRYAGVSDASGRRRLDGLEETGLVEIDRLQSLPGAWVVRLLDPDPQAQRWRLVDDAQRELFGEEHAANTSAGEESRPTIALHRAQDGPGASGVTAWTGGGVNDACASGRAHPEAQASTFARAQASALLRTKEDTISTNTNTDCYRTSIRASNSLSDSVAKAATFAHAQPLGLSAPSPLGESVGGEPEHVQAVRRLPRSLADARAIAETIRLEVGCAKLPESTVEQVARAIVEGRLPLRVLAKTFANLKQARRARSITSTPSAYWTGAIKRQFEFHGIAWEGGAR